MNFLKISLCISQHSTPNQKYLNLNAAMVYGSVTAYPPLNFDMHWKYQRKHLNTIDYKPVLQSNTTIAYIQNFNY